MQNFAITVAAFCVLFSSTMGAVLRGVPANGSAMTSWVRGSGDSGKPNIGVDDLPKIDPKDFDPTYAAQNRIKYGKSNCACIGIDNMLGYYATQVQHHHIQYLSEAGASCGRWEADKHPLCQETPAPEWCNRRWCYVDPCECDLDNDPEPSASNVIFRGQPAYWSYDTCGFTDFYSLGNKESCSRRTDQASCELNVECKWNGERQKCRSTSLSAGCAATKQATDVGQDDCRCVGLDGRDVGHAFLYIDDETLVRYSANVGSTCGAWEMDAHPDCKKDGEKPSWCSQKWCFVDPCKCKTKTPPRTVMPANQHMTFQGKVAFWSYDTCGNEDTWSSSHEDYYCVTQKTRKECNQMKKCKWDGERCLGKALVNICEKQKDTGRLAYDDVFNYKEDPVEAGAFGLKPAIAMLIALAACFQ